MAAHNDGMGTSLIVLSANVRSLVNKFDEVQQVIHETNADIIAITETWLSPEMPDFPVSLPGYTFFRADRSSLGGGVLLMCKTSLFSYLLCSISNTDSEEAIICRLRANDEILPVAVCYRPPVS